MTKCQMEKEQQAKIAEAREKGREKWGGWLQRKIDRSFQREASPAAKLPWLNAQPPKAQPTPHWEADDLDRIGLPIETLQALRHAGFNSCAKVARAEALRQLPRSTNKADVSAALEQLEEM